jgi:hypothetical protein
MTGMKGIPLTLVLLVFIVGCDQPLNNLPKNHTPYQRFVPVSRPPEKMVGVPWTGFFALDTKTGLLCLTTDNHVPPDYQDLPTCTKVMTDWPD